MSFRASAIKSVQRGTVTLPLATASATTTLATTVTAANAYVRALSPEVVDTAADAHFRIELTNGTTVTGYHLGTGSVGITITFEVVEYFAWVLKQSIQAGVVTLTSVASNTATITAVGSKASIVYLGADTTATGGGAFPGDMLTKIALTNSTTVTGSRTGANNNMRVGYAVIDFK